MALSPLEKGYKHKKAELLKLVNLSEEQDAIIQIYLMEEQTGKRHWEWDPADPNIYIEWLNGTTKLRNRISVLSAMDRNQKAMYNRTQGGNNQHGSSPQQQKATKTTSSGRVLTAETHPNLFKPHKRR
jgi:hypothetical protein